MLPPIAVAVMYAEKTKFIFAFSGTLLFLLGTVIWFPFRNQRAEPRIKDGFLIVVSFWLTLCLVSALPFGISHELNVSWIDAIFEASSGITATGATVFTGLDYMPKSILYYRQQLQFLGGMGVILLAIAVLPALGVGGMQLFQAEITGPTKNTRLTPRIAQTAKALWMIYVGLTVFCAIGYWASGMNLFDAITISFGTVSTGGYTTHDQSIGYFQNHYIEIVAVVFMFLGAVSFTLHYITANYASLKHYLYNLELRAYVILTIAATIACSWVLWKFDVFNSSKDTIIESLFHVVSLCTTTGFSSTDYYNWPLFVPIVLLLLGLVGGCAGSTSGGIKMVRLLLLHKQGMREINRLIHPHAHYIIKFGKTPLSDKVINAIWGFLATYMAVFALLLILLLATGLDFLTAYSATAASLSNIGPGLGDVARNYQGINDIAKMLLSFTMVIGRLELFTILVLFSPVYWRS